MNRGLCLLAVASFASGCGGPDFGPWDGPYGTKMGIGVDQLSKYVNLEQVSGAMLMSHRAPNMQSGADSYTYIVGKKSGLCAVSGHFTDIRNQPHNFPDQVIERYGWEKASDKGPSSAYWSSTDTKFTDDIDSVLISYTEKDGRQDAVVMFSYKSMKDCR